VYSPNPATTTGLHDAYVAVFFSLRERKYDGSSGSGGSARD